jgi:hypothetical protein
MGQWLAVGHDAQQKFAQRRKGAKNSEGSWEPHSGAAVDDRRCVRSPPSSRAAALRSLWALTRAVAPRGWIRSIQRPMAHETSYINDYSHLEYHHSHLVVKLVGRPKTGGAH